MAGRLKAYFPMIRERDEIDAQRGTIDMQKETIGELHEKVDEQK